MRSRRLTVTPDGAGKRLDQFLAKALPGMSLERARELISAGQVRIRGKVVKPLRRLWGGEEVEVTLPPPRPLPRVEGEPLRVLFEDDALVIVDKPAGLVVEPERGALSVVELLATQGRGFDVAGVAAPGVVHRLDKETSGCLALARTDEGLARLEAAFQERRVDKRYLALVLGEPPATGHLEGPYGRDPANPRRYTTRVDSARRAALSFETRERFAGAALVEVKLETGRTHQIRVQMSEAGHPVLGDPLYGTREAREHPVVRALGRLALHAARLTLEGMGSAGRVVVEAPLPGDLRRALGLLRGGGPP